MPLDVRRTRAAGRAALLETLALFTRAEVGEERKYTFQVEPCTLLSVGNKPLETEDVYERNEFGPEAIHIVRKGELAAKVTPGFYPC